MRIQTRTFKCRQAIRKMSKLAEGKLARLLHGFSNKCPFSIVGLWGQIDVENEVPGL
jgi:hypothetical protein